MDLGGLEVLLWCSRVCDARLEVCAGADFRTFIPQGNSMTYTNVFYKAMRSF